MASKNKTTAKEDDHEGDKHGTKRPVEIENVKTYDVDVHSANAWEAADLGDDGRKSKFLRLMGASTKKQHHGRFIIGDKTSIAHVRSEEEVEKVNSELEDQYRQGLELKISGDSRRHVGLGFHGDVQTSGSDDSVLPEAESSHSQPVQDKPEAAHSDKGDGDVTKEQKKPREKSSSGDESKATSKTLTSRFVRASSS